MKFPDVVVPRLNTRTPLGQALISMFKSIEAELILEGAKLQAIDMYVGNKEQPRSILSNILHDYLETTDGEAF
jgi:hypothetical protein